MTMLLFARDPMGARNVSSAAEAPSTGSEVAPVQIDEDGSGLIRSKGTFAKLWNQESFVGPGEIVIPEKTVEMLGNRLPGDFENHGAVLIAGSWLAHEAPDVLLAMIRETEPRTRLVLLASSRDEREAVIRLLAAHGLSLDADRFLVVPTDTAWVRDYGPIFVCDAAGGYRAFDAAYDRPGRDRDDNASHMIADSFHVETSITPLRWQGGNVLSDGEGLLLTTTQAINANIECGYDVETMTSFLNRQFGVRQILVLEHLAGERTGHIDMIACFTSRDTVVVGGYDKSVDPQNATRLDRNAARLSDVRTAHGALNVIRVPMPSNQDDVWRSYTNVVFANGTVLVPVYPDVDQAGGEEALAIYRRLLPEWKVVGIDASGMARHQGGLRCVTLYAPSVDQDLD